MAFHKMTRGFALSIPGEPDPRIEAGSRIRRVAVAASDYLGLKPALAVAVGDRVRRGQALFTDANVPGVRFAAPGAGEIDAIYSDQTSGLPTLAVEIDEQDDAAPDGQVTFSAYTGRAIPGLNSNQIRDLLLESGLWTALRTRPFSRVPDPQAKPHSILVTAMDTHPLAPSVDVVMQDREPLFEAGLLCVAKLADCPVYLCKAAGGAVTTSPHSGIQVEEFHGVHPAGTPGVHIHELDPITPGKTVWHIGYQDVLAIGALFTTGRLDVERVISLAGPGVKATRLVRTRLGASLADLTQLELKDGAWRILSGPLLTGREVADPAQGYLGRYHSQVTVMPAGDGEDIRIPFRWLWGRLSRLGLYPRLLPMYERPGGLFRALAAGDAARAQRLGCLELDEEDVALCARVAQDPHPYGTLLRKVLDEIHAAGTSAGSEALARPPRESRRL